ncbi:uncharacterized protein isoform X4 [Danio rerio]|uniref:Uncharacterized protein isoform X4 n=2 Tax=Danio rerio TaxID=7955 RepID=A0AC58HK34_DANRE
MRFPGLMFLLPRHGWHGRCAVAMVTAVGLMAVGVREVLISCTCVCERRCAPCRCSSAPSCFLPAAAAPSSASLTEFCSSCRHHGHDSHSGQPSFFKEPYFAIMAVTLIGTDDGSSRLVGDEIHCPLKGYLPGKKTEEQVQNYWDIPVKRGVLLTWCEFIKARIHISAICLQ